MGLVQYAVYDGNGVITSTGICSEKNLQNKIAKGLKAVVGKADDRLQKVVGGKIVNRLNPEPIHALSENLEPLVRITQTQWQAINKRITDLENK